MRPTPLAGGHHPPTGDAVHQHRPGVALAIDSAGGPVEESLRRAEALRASGAEAPILVLGVFERVGSNWFIDSLRPRGVVHNEPFRQQLHPSHPLSALPLAPPTLTALTARTWHPYEWHWLVSFVASKYGTPRHVVKETNLFFAVTTLLDLFPDSPVIVLSRSPVGIASSFARSRLFKRWAYEVRYARLTEAIAHAELAAYRSVLRTDRPDEIQMLTRMIVLNALTLASALDGRQFAKVQYEHALIDRGAALEQAAQLIGRHRIALTDQTGPTAPATGVDDTYSTRNIGPRTLHLSNDDAAVVRREVAALLADASRELPTSTMDRARGWLCAAPELTRPGARRPRTGTPARPADITAASTPRHSPPMLGGSRDGSHPGWRSGPTLRTELVTNGEFRGFLDAMRDAGVDNLISGTMLFCNEAMPHDRGGRLHRHPATGDCVVSMDYETHPVYWVTWIGAAAFARWFGARLPTRHEVDQVAIASQVDLATVNADYRIGDVVPANDDPVGNLQVWCADGPLNGRRGPEPITRYLYGCAWNTPATWAEIRRLRSRHVTGSSRGIGIRLVDPSQVCCPPETAAEIAEDLHRAFARLADRSVSLTALDHELVDAVTRSPHRRELP